MRQCRAISGCASLWKSAQLREEFDRFSSLPVDERSRARWPKNQVCLLVLNEEQVVKPCKQAQAAVAWTEHKVIDLPVGWRLPFENFNHLEVSFNVWERRLEDVGSRSSLVRAHDVRDEDTAGLRKELRIGWFLADSGASQRALSDNRQQRSNVRRVTALHMTPNVGHERRPEDARSMEGSGRILLCVLSDEVRCQGAGKSGAAQLRHVFCRARKSRVFQSVIPAQDRYPDGACGRRREAVQNAY